MRIVRICANLSAFQANPDANERIDYENLFRIDRSAETEFGLRNPRFIFTIHPDTAYRIILQAARLEYASGLA
jgi:hypothetical protein